MSLGVVPTALVVPPTNFLLLALAGWLLRRFRRLARALLATGLAGLLLLSLPIVSETLKASLERGMPTSAPPENPPTAIVILSGDAARNDGRLEVGRLTLERERAGAALRRRTGLPILVTGGSVEDSDQTLGGLMARSLAEDFQVPTEWVEQKAQDTRENAVLSAAILRMHGVKSVYLVTHAWHMKRSILAFSDTGVAVVASPVRIDEMPTGRLSDFVPRASSWLDSYYALHEWIGWLAGRVAMSG